MKKVMILGGGYYQLPLIKKSVELGYHTIVCGIDGNYPGYKYATEWINANTFNKEQILEVAIEKEIDGILLCGSDACMPTIGYVCDKLHLIGPTEQSTLNASNKSLMKDCFSKHGVRTAKYKKIYSQKEAEAYAEESSYPVVLKVVDASGSRGVAIVKNYEELTEQYPRVIRETKKDYIIIEQFIKGKEFGAQSFVRNGRLTFVMPHGDILFHSDTDVPIGHYAPFENDTITGDILHQLELCVQSLGIDNTAINADFILHEEQVYVLEIGARAGATCLPELVSNYYGIDYYEYLLRQSLGEPIDFVSKKQTPSLVETLISEQTGVVEKIEIGKLPEEVLSFELYPKVGDKVSKFRNAFDRIGTLILKGESLQHLYTVSSDIKNNKLKLTIRKE